MLARIPAQDNNATMEGTVFRTMRIVGPVLDEASRQKQPRPVWTIPRSFSRYVIETFLSSNHFCPTGPVL